MSKYDAKPDMDSKNKTDMDSKRKRATTKCIATALGYQLCWAYHAIHVTELTRPTAHSNQSGHHNVPKYPNRTLFLVRNTNLRPVLGNNWPKINVTSEIRIWKHHRWICWARKHKNIILNWVYISFRSGDTGKSFFLRPFWKSKMAATQVSAQM